VNYSLDDIRPELKTWTCVKWISSGEDNSQEKLGTKRYQSAGEMGPSAEVISL
jgi:hypothetical protein